MTAYIVDLNMFGQNKNITHVLERLTDVVHQVLPGTQEEDLGAIEWLQRQRRSGKILPIDTNGPWS